MEGDAVEHVGVEGWFDEGHEGTDHSGDATQPEEMLPKESWGVGIECQCPQASQCGRIRVGEILLIA